MAHSRSCPHDCPVCDESIAGKEDGLTAATAIKLYCPVCNNKAIVNLGDLSVYCFSCENDFPYVYTKDLWYTSESPLSIFTQQYIGGPWYWNTETQIFVHKLV